MSDVWSVLNSSLILLANDLWICPMWHNIFFLFDNARSATLYIQRWNCQTYPKIKKVAFVCVERLFILDFYNYVAGVGTKSNKVEIGRLSPINELNVMKCTHNPFNKCAVLLPHLQMDFTYATSLRLSQYTWCAQVIFWKAEHVNIRWKYLSRVTLEIGSWNAEKSNVNV